MRHSRVKDFWDKFENLEPYILPQKISTFDIVGIEDCEQFVESPLTVLCGNNGTGKTTYLSALYNLFSSLYENDLINDDRITSATFNTIVKERRNVKSYATEDKSELGDTSTYFIDCGSYPPAIQKLFKKETDFDELLAEYNEQAVDGDESHLNDTLFKNYEKISVWEIDDYQGLVNVPYVRVCVNGVEYGAESMGLGEYSVFFLYWRLLTAQEGSLFFIEEPESHLSPMSQFELMNLVIPNLVKKKSYLFLNTHSPSLLSRVDDKYIRLAIPCNGHTKIAKTQNYRQGLFELGLRPEVKGLLLVEDKAAQLFLLRILSTFDDGEITKNCQIICCKGHSHIKSLLDNYPQTEDSVTMYGVFDGDVEPPHLPRRNTFFGQLPSSVDPELMAMRLLKEASHQGRFARCLALNVQDVENACSKNEYRNHHEWAYHVGLELSRSKDTVIETIFSIGLKYDSGIKREAKALIRDIKEKLNVG